jgi:hypothetical protein
MRLNTKIPAYRPSKDLEIDYQDFGGGWNNIFRPTELKPNELAQADNLLLTGKGIPTGRWGSENYFTAGSGNVRLINSYEVPTTGVSDLLALTDEGYLVEKSGASYSVITGASFPSGYNAQSEQLGGYLYVAHPERPLARYDGTDLISYTTLPTPSGIAVSMLSGASGTTTWSWRVTALSAVGETVGSTAITLSNLEIDLDDCLFRVAWSTISAASGVLKGYTVYRGLPGNETYIGTAGVNETSFMDYGTAQSDLMFPPNADTTGGPKAKYVLKFDDRLVLAGIENDPTLVLISGRYPYQDRFNWADGGGYIRINPDGGDSITGLGISGSQTQGGTTPASVLVFMENSVHQLVLKSLSVGNYLLLDPQSQILAPTGCSSADTVIAVDNNTFYFGRNGLFTIGSEASYLNQIRTREISARIRPYIRGLAKTDFENATAGYIDYKYLLSFPAKKETIVYDFERACFMGPWKTPWGITKWKKYIDTDGNEQWLAGTDTGIVKKFSASLLSDSGTAIQKLLKTKKEDFKDWSVMKVIKTLYVLFRSVTGSVTINISLEERNGTVITTKSFDITGSAGVAGWGADMWGNAQWGDTVDSVSIASEDIIRWTQLYKTARVMQIEVISTGATSNWEFLGVKASAQPMSEGSLSSSSRV